MTAYIDAEKCNGCKKCYENCPLDIITWDEEKNRPNVSYPDECQLCFICQEECPVDAVKVKVPIIFW
jgi:NAD-dependent dihydropyrimidine dehydrogenase PreA subunit